MELKNKTYKNHINSFQSWLQTLGYAKSTVTGSPAYVKEFLFYLETNHVTSIYKITNQTIKEYFIYLSRRKNIKKAGALSINTLRNNLSALRRFGKFLRETGQGNLEVSINLPVSRPQIKTILTKNEIKTLYQETDQTVLGLRDRAMLSIYYGCGLRRNEGVSLNTGDIMLGRNKIFVNSGKRYKERFVPITHAIKEYLENYLQQARTFLTIGKPAETAFFVGMRGNRISGNMLYVRLQQLKEKAGIIKEIGLHTLRHSIATHLLKDGMKIEMVSQFLGHESLESTQIYTHLSAETE